MSEVHGSDPSSVLDHNYDGIQEYDNPLPGWWVWTFWLTILFAFPYTVYYHFGEGPSLDQAYEAEVADHANQLLATYGKLAPDAPTILKYRDDAVAMAGMASLFRSKCAQCHRADGTGMVGPNLTDDRWINVKAVTDIAKVIQDGVVLKGMPTWKDQLTDTQIVLLASYVTKLAQSPKPGKEPQGDAIAPFAANP
jgi:cytochrome c oxidase cbb3-type subunit 3